MDTAPRPVAPSHTHRWCLPVLALGNSCCFGSCSAPRCVAVTETAALQFQYCAILTGMRLLDRESTLECLSPFPCREEHRLLLHSILPKETIQRMKVDMDWAKPTKEYENLRITAMGKAESRPAALIA